MRILQCCSSEDGSALVSGHLDTLSARVRAVIEPAALVLVGSYGRGEGVVRGRGDALEPVNDYDVVLVTNTRIPFHERRQLKKLREEVAQELNIRHVDLILMEKSSLQNPRVEMLRHDMKFGAQVFYGDPEILSEIPYEEWTPIPASEALNLLINRMVTLLEGHPETSSLSDLSDKARQIAKVQYALIDSVLIESASYATRYRQKREGLMSVSEHSDLVAFLKGQLHWLERAWSFTLPAEELAPEKILELWKSTREMQCDEILRLTALVADARVTPEDIARAWRGGGQKGSLFDTAFRLLLRKGDKYNVEQQIYSLLTAAARVREQDSEASRISWGRRAQRLIESWYSAV